MNNKVSVRELIEYTYRSGDIDQSFKSSTKQLEGQEIHKYIQSNFPLDVESEVMLRIAVEDQEIELLISGRADGVRYGPNPCVIEIKSTKRKLDEIDEPISVLHLYQAMLYAYMLAVQEDYEQVEVLLIYGQLQGKANKQLPFIYSFEMLSNFFEKTFALYKRWIQTKALLHQRLMTSALATDFPFPFRKGQRQMSVGVYKGIINEEVLLIEAPTGIGKTLSTLFPTLKAYAHCEIDKIFYLTPKTTGRANAKRGLRQLEAVGFLVTSVELQAKEKLCLNSEFTCHPNVCPFAKGHYDRINEGLFDALDHEFHFDVNHIKYYAVKHQLCPFELALDLALFAGVIICDYNYVWDPNVQLKRFFSEPKKHILLVDEAHNLVDRSRSMYSSELNQGDLKNAIRLTKGISKKLHSAFSKLQRLIKKKVLGLDEECLSETEFPAWLYEGCLSVKGAFEGEEPDVLNTLGAPVLEFYFAVLSYLKRLEFFGDEFLHLYREKGLKGYSITLFCRDAARMLNQSYGQVKAVALFSATLSPVDYFKNCFGLDQKTTNVLRLRSPYPPEHLKLTIERYSTRFKDREATLDSIVRCIQKNLQQTRGNSIVFFPSYDYLKRVQSQLEDRGNLSLLVQSRSMTEENRDDFLNAFEQGVENPVIGLCVLGGVFAEGIDLKADRLSCVIIVGVGLPMINEELQLIEAYYDQQDLRGYDYTYTIPGLIRVLQAGGRLIRDQEDKGRLVLIDDRYEYGLYKRLLPEHWIISRDLTMRLFKS